MFNNLVSTLVNWMASGLDFAINWIIKMLGFNISFFTNNFPVVLTLYGIGLKQHPQAQPCARTDGG